MIYTLIGTDPKKREKALAEVATLGAPNAHIYSEQISALKPLIEAGSLFGDKVIAHLIQTLERAETREYVYDLLPDMEKSENIFFIDEPFADANRAKKLEKYSKKLFDARELVEEKEKGASPFSLSNAFARRDKKAVWVEWMKLRDSIEPEAIQGALWWKFQSIWSDARSGKPGKYTLEECEQIGGRILRSSILAHRGEKDLKVELESILLSI
jgi:hypothetical protein